MSGGQIPRAVHDLFQGTVGIWLCGEGSSTCHFGHVATSYNTCAHFSAFMDDIMHFEFFLLKYSWFTMCQFLLYSKVAQSYVYIHSFPYVIFHHGLFQEIGYSSLSLHSRTSLLTYSKCNSLHLLTPNSRPSHSLHSPPWQP